MAPDPAPDQVTAYLTGARERSERPLAHVTSLPISHDGVRTLMGSAADVPRLLAAVEAALGLATDWEQQAAVMERAADLDDPEIWNERASELRTSVSRALLGEVPGA